MSGVIAAGNSYTANAGAEILRQGGNAVDAAVAAAFVSCLAEPALVCLGGSGVAQVFDSGTGQGKVYDFFSNMPGIDSEGGSGIIDFRRVQVDFGVAQQVFFIGRASVAVPGLIAGLCKMLEEAGTFSLPAVLAPAIELARSGVPLDQQQAHMVQLISSILRDTRSMAEVFAPGGKLIQQGDLVRFPNLAETLEQLAQEGPHLFYRGKIAQTIVIDQLRAGGFITSRDLEDYQVHSTQAITVPYRGYSLLLPPPSSAGGVLIAFALRLLEVQSLTGVTPLGPDHIRLLAEVMRLTNIARVEWEEARYLPGALERFLSDSYLDSYQQKLQNALDGNPTSEPQHPPSPPNTTHISVADGNGMVVSLTHSGGENAGFVLGKTGVTLNNMLGEMDLHPKGFHTLAPGERLQTMMSPVIVLKDGQPVLALGSGGSNRLRTAILQVISHRIDFGMSLEEAVNAPRVHFEDNVLQLEKGIEAKVAFALERLYEVNRWMERSMFFGGVHAVCKQGDDWVAVGDSRRGGYTIRVP